MAIPISTDPQPNGPVSLRRHRFETLFAEESRAILGYALRRVTAAEDAADVVAETFLVAWRRIDDVPTGADARPWLYGVARRVLANQLRGAGRRSRLADRLRDEMSIALDTTGHEQPDVVGTVQEAMGRLSDDDRELLRLTNWEGLSPSELAAAMAVTPPTVRTRLHRARRRLKNELEALGWTGSERSGPTGHVEGDGRVPVRLKEER